MYDAKKTLPDKTDLYLVRRKVHKNPTFAVFVHTKKTWMVVVNGQYWPITGVQLCAEIPEEFRKKEKS